MPLAGNTNHIGTMYAGCIFTLGEMAGGAIFGACFDFTRLLPIVKEVTIRYRRPVMTDITLEASLTGERVREVEDGVAEKGKCDFVLDLEIADTQGEIVALVHGTWQVRPSHRSWPTPWHRRDSPGQGTWSLNSRKGLRFKKPAASTSRPCGASGS